MTMITRFVLTLLVGVFLAGCQTNSAGNSFVLESVDPSDMIDQIGGWSTAGVGQSYGEGFTLEILLKVMHPLSVASIQTDQMKQT